MTHWTVILAAVLYPLLTYVAVVTGKPALALAALGLIMIPFLSRRLQGSFKFYYFFFLLFLSLTFIDIRVREEWPVLLYFPPIIISGFFLWGFGRTLRTGREPMVTTFCRLARGDLSKELLRYTRRLTWFWTILLAAMTLNTVLLAIFAPIRIWALFTNIINYLIILTVFAVEYVYRILRFPYLSHTSPFALISKMMKRGGWSSLPSLAKTEDCPELSNLKENET
jgi:uncharacterized membrane protein